MEEWKVGMMGKNSPPCFSQVFQYSIIPFSPWDLARGIG
jgi:hypothetical protein